MSRLLTSGWEIYVDPTNSTTPGVDGTADTTGATRDTTLKRSGVASLRIDGTVSTINFFNISGALDRSYWSRAYLYVTTLPTANAAVLQHGNSNVQLNTSGQLFSNLNSGATSAAINDGNWHRIEFFTKPSATQANRAWELRVDGVTVSSGTAQATDSAAYSTVRLACSQSAVLNFDDFALNDSQGASQNSWPGAGSVVCLVPTADSAVGTGWTLGTGTAISGGTGKTAVSNRPPIGVADLAAGSDPKQIRNATSNANVNYDATMTTYTAAGVGAGATINVIDPVTATAAPVSTSAKQGTVGVVSNPAITNIALAIDGAFWAGSVAGVYPVGWKWSHGTATYAPSVTLGTAPVMRVTQVTASTRIAMVCFMGIYVDYTPVGGTTYTKTGNGRENG